VKPAPPRASFTRVGTGGGRSATGGRPATGAGSGLPGLATHAGGSGPALGMLPAVQLGAVVAPLDRQGEAEDQGVAQGQSPPVHVDIRVAGRQHEHGHGQEHPHGGIPGGDPDLARLAERAHPDQGANDAQAEQGRRDVDCSDQGNLRASMVRRIAKVDILA